MKTKTRQRVTVYQREYNGTTKLWLNWRVNGQRFREPLNLYLDPAKTAEAKIKNSTTMRLAEEIAAQKSEELRNAELGIEVKSQKLTLFSDYSKKDIEATASKKYRNMKIDLCRKVLRWNPSIRLVDFNRNSLRDFLKFLKNTGNSPNSTITRFTILKGILHRAALDGIISAQPDYTGLAPKRVPSERKFLTVEELKKLIETPIKDRWGKPFLFSCFTGLRYSDLEHLKWSDIQDGNDGRKVIVIRQKKTKEIVRIPLSKNAERFLPEKTHRELIFWNLADDPRLSKYVREWCYRAGIKKYITFHCARHTFATLSLNGGADLYAVSKVLGHTSVKTTAIYAKALDEVRQKAVDAIPEI